MDGYEVAKRLRREDRPGCHDYRRLWVRPGADRRHTKAVGSHHHLVKPIDFDALRSLLAGKTPDPSPRLTPGPPSHPQPRVSYFCSLSFNDTYFCTALLR